MVYFKRRQGFDMVIAGLCYSPKGSYRFVAHSYIQVHWRLNNGDLMTVQSLKTQTEILLSCWSSYSACLLVWILAWQPTSCRHFSWSHLLVKQHKDPSRFRVYGDGCIRGGRQSGWLWGQKILPDPLGPSTNESQGIRGSSHIRWAALSMRDTCATT